MGGKEQVLFRGECFIVCYFLTLPIKIIDAGEEGSDTLANGNLRKYNIQNLWREAVLETHVLENLQEPFSCFLPSLRVASGSYSKYLLV